jgi:hypothetical protein
MHDVLAAPVGRGGEGERGGFGGLGVPVPPLAWYSLGALAGGALSGAALGAVGSLARSGGGPVDAVVVLAAVAVAVAAVVLQRQGRVGPLPQRSAQVPRRFVLWRWRSLCAGVWGFMLGSAVMTYLHYAALYVVAACVVAVGSVPFGLVVGLVYGFTRGATLVAGAVEVRGRSCPPERLMRAAIRSERLLAHGSAVATAAVVAVAILEASTRM